MIGEDPEDIPNNLVPFVAKVSTGELAKISVLAMTMTPLTELGYGIIFTLKTLPTVMCYR